MTIIFNTRVDGDENHFSDYKERSHWICKEYL